MNRNPRISDEIADSPLAIQGLTVSYDHRPVVYSVDFVTPPESMTAIVGPNGAGKSSLLKAVWASPDP
ncbi:ATP-binding cassette domain-containing protein [Halomonas sp.]|uniref:ATP-binding cassette domain-containing protein n=1 Tax=Halomonas sp. TaxID=1486246 RepID=UPI0035681B45